VETKQLADEICKLLSSKKAEDILLIDVSKKTTLADYFIIASGRSTTQVKSLCENIEDKFAKLGLEPKNRDGVREGRWAALDYGDIIVHIFNDEQRLFYHLERLWSDSDNIEKFES
jgi:ribosome-associated protein